MKKVIGILALLLLVLLASTKTASANHSWGGYHWARTANPFTLKLGDNLSSNWKSYLGTASTDWSVSSVLDTTIVPGQAKASCKPISGRVEVCNKAYGNNGWLGIAQIWVSGGHITQGTTKMNDTYFNTSTYNKPAWKQFVVCQEVGHAFGLDHRDEVFGNTNLGTCMDYTSDPDGTLGSQLSNLHPNQHDYDELGTIYSHLDPYSTVLNLIRGQSAQGTARLGDQDLEDRNQWGKLVKDGKKVALYERDFGGGNKVFTFVIKAN